MKETEPTKFERLAQANQAREQMIEKNLVAWLPPNNENQTTHHDSVEVTPLPLVTRLPKPVRRLTYSGLTITGLAAACALPGDGEKEVSQSEGEVAGQPQVERIEESNRLDWPFPSAPDMEIQTGWFRENGQEHKGIDFIKGTPDRSSTWQPFDVLAAADGAACLNPPHREGTAVLIKHFGGRFYTYYGHLNQVESQIPECFNTITVRKGQRVGIAGATGLSNPKWIHLHFQVNGPDGRTPIDPYDIYAKRTQYPNPTFTNGKVCGENHLWIYCPTTLQEQIPTPIPTFGEAQVLSTQNIKIIKENLVRCRVSPDSTELSQDYWGGWIVENERQDFWIKNFNAQIELKSPEGLVVNTIQVEGVRVVAPASEKTWIVGTGRGGIGSREIFPVFVYSGEGSRVADINLILTGPFNWEPALDKKTDYRLTSEVVSHRLNNPYNLAPGYGRHELAFSITNTGNLALTNPSVFGFIYNLRGELVDIVWGWLRKPNKQNYISAGETVEIKTPSVSRTGRCAGKIDPVGYTLEYFVDFQGINENALSVHDIVGIR